MLIRTSGLDASLGFEGKRDENKGLFVDDTMQFLANVSEGEHSFIHSLEHL